MTRRSDGPFTPEQIAQHHRFLAEWTATGITAGYDKRPWRALDARAVDAIKAYDERSFERVLVEAAALRAEQAAGRAPDASRTETPTTTKEIAPMETTKKGSTTEATAIERLMVACSELVAAMDPDALAPHEVVVGFSPCRDMHSRYVATARGSASIYATSPAEALAGLFRKLHDEARRRRDELARVDALGELLDQLK